MLKEENKRRASTSFNIRDNKRNVEQILKQSLNAFYFDSTSFNAVSSGVENGFNIALQQNRMDVEANVEAVCSGLKQYTSALLSIMLDKKILSLRIKS